MCVAYIATVICSYICWFIAFAICKYHSIDFDNCDNVDECYKVLNTEFWKFVHYSLWTEEYVDTNKPRGIIWMPFGNFIVIIICIMYNIMCFIIFIIIKMKICEAFNYIYNTIKIMKCNINNAFHKLLSKIKLK